MLLFRLKRQQCGFIHAPSVVLFSSMATSKHFSIIECLRRNGSTIVLPQREKSEEFKSERNSSSLSCLIHYLIVCVFISIDFFFFNIKTDGEKITCSLLNTGTITAGAHILYQMNNAIHKWWKISKACFLLLILLVSWISGALLGTAGDLYDTFSEKERSDDWC